MKLELMNQKKYPTMLKLMKQKIITLEPVKLRTLSITVLAWCMLTACSNHEGNTPEYAPPTNEEVQYASSHGWSIQQVIGEEQYSVQQLYAERIERVKSNGIEIEACTSGKFHSRAFSVSEQQKDGGSITISLYYCVGEERIIGGAGGLENWTPGTFPITDKQRLIEDGTVAE